MDKTYNDMNSLMVVKGNDEEQILGKFLYFSLSNLLISKNKIKSICDEMGLPVQPSNRISSVDAFKSATGDIHDRKELRTSDGFNISKIYFRDNKKTDEDTYSRELIQETINESTNRYRKLANVFHNKKNGSFDYVITSMCNEYDVEYYCEKAKQLFDTYQSCIQGKHIETMTSSMLNRMESIKIDVHGRLYFVPKRNIHYLSVFEDFLEALSANNMKNSTITVNSMFVSDDEKQRSKMAGEFSKMTQKDIDLYTSKIENLITTGSKSETVINRWLLKVQTLENKKTYYEELLQKEITDLNDSFLTLKILSQELAVRGNKSMRAAS